MRISAPEPAEYPASYQSYIASVQNVNMGLFFIQQGNDFSDFIRNIPEEKAGYRYATGKWTVKEVLGHVIDTERVKAYRALAFSRGDRQPLPGFEQDEYVLNASFSSRSLESLADEFIYLRKANYVLFQSFDESTLNNAGIANDKPVTVRALIYVIAGHLNHHLHILKEKYL